MLGLRVLVLRLRVLVLRLRVLVLGLRVFVLRLQAFGLRVQAKFDDLADNFARAGAPDEGRSGARKFVVKA